MMATEISDPSLAGGTAGLAVLCTYLALAGYDDGENAERFLEEAAQALSSGPMEPWLYRGLAGIAWASAHLQQQLFEVDEENSNVAIDEALRAFLDRSPWRGDYDLVSGLVGFGIYVLERGRSSGCGTLPWGCWPGPHLQPDVSGLGEAWLKLVRAHT